MYACKNEEGKTAFRCADAISVVEVEAKYASDKKDHVLYWYVERVDKDGKLIKRIIDFDDKNKYFYLQTDEGEILPDKRFKGKNAKPHITYRIDGDSNTYYDNYGLIPFFRLDNNKKQHSSLKTIKPLIDDYDMMASSLSNNLVDFDTPIHLVKGFEGDNLDELQTNLKTKKIVGVGENGGMEVMTVDIPYAARQTKLELDEKNIYRFGFGLNLSGLKDTAATTNIAIKEAYSLLYLKCSKIEIRLKQFMRKIIKVVLQEVNTANETDYQMKDIYFNFEHEIMSNASENAQNGLIEAQTRQTEITSLLNIASLLDNETLMQLICEQFDIDYDDIKNKLPDPDEADTSINEAQSALNGVIAVE
jgi:SPP1 family phage portal protein